MVGLRAPVAREELRDEWLRGRCAAVHNYSHLGSQASDLNVSTVDNALATESGPVSNLAAGRCRHLRGVA